MFRLMFSDILLSDDPPPQDDMKKNKNTAYLRVDVLKVIYALAC